MSLLNGKKDKASRTNFALLLLSDCELGKVKLRGFYYRSRGRERTQ